MRNVELLNHPTDASTPADRQAERKYIENSTHRDQHLVLRDTLIFHPFAQTSESDTGCLAYTGISIIEARLYHRPHVFHNGCHVFTTTFDRYAEGEHRSTAVVCIRGLEILLDEGPKRGKDLSRGKGGGQIIDYS
jgi:hypothetical protein